MCKVKNLEVYKGMLIVVDMVNGFVREGVLHDEAISEIIPRQIELIKEAKARGDLVVFIKDTHDDDAIEFRRFGDTKHCVRGTSEANLVDELIGFDIELAKAVGEKLGLEVVFQVINWNTKVFELESKAIDVIWNGMTITDKIKEETSVTIPYLKNKQVAVIRVEDKDKYKTTKDMLDAVICVESGSAGQICVEVEK